MLESINAHVCGKGTVRRHNSESMSKRRSNRVGQYSICVTNLENKAALSIGNNQAAVEARRRTKVFALLTSFYSST